MPSLSVSVEEQWLNQDVLINKHRWPNHIDQLTTPPNVFHSIIFHQLTPGLKHLTCLLFQQSSISFITKILDSYRNSLRKIKCLCLFICPVQFFFDTTRKQKEVRKYPYLKTLQSTALATARFQSSSLQNCETIIFCCSKPLSLPYFFMLAIGNEYNM